MSDSIKNVPWDLAVRHFATMPCNSANEIVRNADVPDFLPRLKFAFGFDGASLDPVQHSAAIRPCA